MKRKPVADSTARAEVLGFIEKLNDRAVRVLPDLCPMPAFAGSDVQVQYVWSEKHGQQDNNFPDNYWAGLHVNLTPEDGPIASFVGYVKSGGRYAEQQVRQLLSTKMPGCFGRPDSRLHPRTADTDKHYFNWPVSTDISDVDEIWEAVGGFVRELIDQKG